MLNAWAAGLMTRNDRAFICTNSTAPTGRSLRWRRTAKTIRVKEKIAKLKEEMQRLEALDVRMLATPDQQISLTDRRCPLDGDKRPGFRRRRL